MDPKWFENGSENLQKHYQQIGGNIDAEIVLISTKMKSFLENQYLLDALAPPGSPPRSPAWEIPG